MFPASMLARLVIKGSLKNVDGGFEIRMNNIIDSGTLVGLGALLVDGKAYPADQITLTVGEKQVQGDQLSFRAPLPLRVYANLRVFVTSEALEAGPHKLGFELVTSEIGRLKFEVTEELAA